MAWLINQYPSTYVRRMVTRWEQSVAAGVEVVRSLLDPIEGDPMLYVNQTLIESRDARGIARCLAGYRYKTKADGTIDPDHFFKCNVLDHGADALRMLCRVMVEAAEGRGSFNIARRQGDGRIHSDAASGSIARISRSGSRRR